jgi:hypothetical protein
MINTSKKRAAELRHYRTLRKMFLSTHTACEACQLVFMRPPKKATDVHHSRGRTGRLLCMVEFFKAVCRGCHDWIGHNPRKASGLGLNAPYGQWNTIPKSS